MASVTIKSAGEEYVISITSPATCVGPDEAFAATIAKITDNAASEYSVAFGGPASFVANVLKERLGAEVVSIEEPSAEEGVVY